jgi:hypothetical protein
VPSIANLRALADECVRLGRHDEAIDLYKSALTGMHQTIIVVQSRRATCNRGAVPRGGSGSGAVEPPGGLLAECPLRGGHAIRHYDRVFRDVRWDAPWKSGSH